MNYRRRAALGLSTAVLTLLTSCFVARFELVRRLHDLRPRILLEQTQRGSDLLEVERAEDDVGDGGDAAPHAHSDEDDESEESDESDESDESMTDDAVALDDADLSESDEEGSVDGDYELSSESSDEDGGEEQDDEDDGLTKDEAAALAEENAAEDRRVRDKIRGLLRWMSAMTERVESGVSTALNEVFDLHDCPLFVKIKEEDLSGFMNVLDDCRRNLLPV
jgi:hypothetical protein